MFTGFDPPSSMFEATNRMRELQGEIQTIETQLGDRVRRSHAEPGTEEYERYWTWNQSARWALTAKLEELRLVRSWITENKEIFA